MLSPVDDSRSETHIKALDKELFNDEKESDT
jgi:hypothetical protein